MQESANPRGGPREKPDGCGRDAAAIDVSVVIPVYRAGGSLPQLLRELVDVLDALGRRYEIVCVDDGSPDDSWSVLRELAGRYGDQLVAVALMRNFGQHNALMCGFRHARGRLIVTMDDDLQHPPAEVPKLIAALSDGQLDLVYGTFDRTQDRAWRNVTSWLVHRLFRAIFRSPVAFSPFRAIRSELVQCILEYDMNFTFVDGLFAWNTQRVGQVVTQHRPRQAGRSGYSARSLVMLTLNLFTNFSLVPLQAVAAVGTFAAITGLALGAFYVVQYLRSAIVVPGYASTIVVVLVMGGLQLLSLGVIGEYLGRLHLNVSRKPQYTVRQVLRGNQLIEET
jgi:undecaprenyl-phosphate 4-deoxy-4-formamido-L-arabinose transferase